MLHGDWSRLPESRNNDQAYLATKINVQNQAGVDFGLLGTKTYFVHVDRVPSEICHLSLVSSGLAPTTPLFLLRFMWPNLSMQEVLLIDVHRNPAEL